MCLSILCNIKKNQEIEEYLNNNFYNAKKENCVWEYNNHIEQLKMEIGKKIRKNLWMGKGIGICFDYYGRWM